MGKYLAAYAGCLACFLAIDAIWLGLVAKRFYADQLGDLLKASPSLGVAAVFYLAYAVAVVILAVRPAIIAESPLHALALGAVLGFAAYGTYDITNLATIRNWPWQVSAVDWAWGTVLTGVSAWAGYHASRAL